MMSDIVVRKSYNEPDFCEKTILRYAGCKKAADDISRLVNDCLRELKGKLTYKVCYREFPVAVENDRCDLGFVKADSSSLAKNLHGCNSIIVFAATTGIELDRLIAKYSKVSPAKALLFQAIGAERIEALCDTFNNEVEAHMNQCGFFLRPRFSPGYGDLPLEIQRDLFAVLDCPKQIGLTLNDSLLMSPSKSVTAIIGIAKTPTAKCKNKCSLCGNKGCSFRGV